jgi:drug/metabolite transporter (DMT)-like permease
MGMVANGRLHSKIETATLTLLALIAFASNSILTRLALGPRSIDAASFTLVRLAAGALMLAFIVRLRTRGWMALRGGRIAGPLALFAYAAPFSFAYLSIGAAAGALVLFGVVQVTMIGWGIISGERLLVRTWVGLVVALGGLGMLTLPSAGRPDPAGIALMALAGIAWGVYSLMGKTEVDPVAANASNFLWSIPLAVLLIVLLPPSTATPLGLTAAAASGAVTSGLGYAIWYRALRGLDATQAAIVQLSVPVIAALAAVALLGEVLSIRLLMSGVITLSGIALVLSARMRAYRKPA